MVSLAIIPTLYLSSPDLCVLWPGFHALTASPSLSRAEENLESLGGSVALSVSANALGPGTELFWSISQRDYSIRHALEDELNLEASQKIFHDYHTCSMAILCFKIINLHDCTSVAAKR